MSKLKQPLRLWHGLLAIVAALAVGAAGTAIAGGEGGPGNDVTTAGFGPGGFVKSGKYRYGFKVRGLPAGDSQRSTRIKCPRKTKVIGEGGGGSSSEPDEQAIIWNGPFDSGDRDLKPEDGWILYVNSLGLEGNESRSVWAVCVKRG